LDAESNSTTRKNGIFFKLSTENFQAEFGKTRCVVEGDDVSLFEIYVGALGCSAYSSPF